MNSHFEFATLPEAKYVEELFVYFSRFTVQYNHHQWRALVVNVHEKIVALFSNILNRMLPGRFPTNCKAKKKGKAGVSWYSRKLVIWWSTYTSLTRGGLNGVLEMGNGTQVSTDTRNQGQFPQKKILIESRKLVHVSKLRREAVVRRGRKSAAPAKLLSPPYFLPF